MHTLAEPLVLRVPGEVWDSQIYEGRLYLFNVDGSITTLDWDHLIGSWEIPDELRLALDCAFRQGNYLYGSRWDLFFKDPDVTRLLISKFSRLRSIVLEPSAAMLDAATVKQQVNPFPFPHADATLYGRNLYVVSRDGLCRASVSKRRVYPISRQADDMWDGNVVSVAASYGTLALAGGEDGLFQRQLDVGSEWQAVEEPEPLSQRRCDRCAWTYWSIFGSSLTSGGYLAEFHRSTSRYDRAAVNSAFGAEPGASYDRGFVGLTGAEEIFGREGFAWAGQDKIYTAAAGELRVAVYDPFAEEDQRTGRRRARNRPKFHTVGAETLNGLGGKRIRGAEVARFGTVVEGEDALVVFLSNGDRFHIPGEFSRWRIFPRSKQYANQLHVVFDDHLAIFSFNQDYLVNQADKLFGMRVYGSS